MITAVLARNEASKYLDRVIRHHRQFGRVLVLDDDSTDDTIAVAESAGAEVRSRQAKGGMWGRESSARQELWEWGAGEDEWMFIADADHIIADPRPLCTSWEVNTWSFALLDLWDRPDQHRVDGYWQGYQLHRPWLFAPSRVPQGWVPEWGSRGIHCGHAPLNWSQVAIVGQAPEPWHIDHYGWLSPEHRRQKYRRYRKTWEQLSDFERGHVQSILDT